LLQCDGVDDTSSHFSFNQHSFLELLQFELSAE